MDKRPIGVFDSGVGGLTVFREIAARLPHETLIYLGDSARVPYGTKSPETIQRYAREAARFLHSRDIKLFVVACNTASAAALPVLEQEMDIPVIGVVRPGAEAAVAATRGKIGVIATEGTVRSQAYSRAIAHIDDSVEVREQPCPLFVPLAEEGWANTRVAMEVAEVYLRPLLDWGVDTLVLGCTHYPILRRTIHAVAGDGVRIVDSAETTAKAVETALEGRLRTDPSSDPRYRFLVTDAAERFRRIAGEFLDHEVDHLELVDLVW
jgi:glutamate racemase